MDAGYPEPPNRSLLPSGHERVIAIETVAIYISIAYLQNSRMSSSQPVALPEAYFFEAGEHAHRHTVAGIFASYFNGDFPVRNIFAMFQKTPALKHGYPLVI